MITKELLVEMFDYKDGQLFWKVMPGCRSDIVGKKAGSKNESGYERIKVLGKLRMTHRLVFLMHHGYTPFEIDHIDGNRLNNRIENLREVTKFQNCWNRGTPKSNTSGIKGVCWHKKAKAWYVQLQVKKKMKYLGIYDDIELAELVVQEARSLYHGEYARNT